MKRRTGRILAALLVALAAALLLCAAALAEGGGIRVYTAPDGLDSGAYYFDMEDGTLYSALNARHSEGAEADIAAFKAAEWYIDPESLELSAVFPADYDPSAFFDLKDKKDSELMFSILRIAGQDALEWGAVRVPNDPTEVWGYAHREYYIDLARAYAVTYEKAYTAGGGPLDDPEDEYYLQEDSAQKAMNVLTALQSMEYGVRPEDPLFRVKMTMTDPGGDPKVLYYPYDALVSGYAEDDISPYVKEYHDYLYNDTVSSWEWTDPDTVTVTYRCYLGDETIAVPVPAENITKDLKRQATELTDGLLECTATMDFYETTYSDKTVISNTHTFVLSAKGEPQRLTITAQPQSGELLYPEGAKLSVAVDDPEFVESYKWYDTDALGRPVELDGMTASEATLVIPSTQSYSTFDLYCVITDKNGNSVTTDTAHLEVTNGSERLPVVYVGDWALQPGETLDLAETKMGSGTVSFAENASELTLENAELTAGAESYLFDTLNSPSLGLFIACPGYEFENGKFYVHVIGDCFITSTYYDAEHYSGGIVLNSQFYSGSVETYTQMVIDGEGTLTLAGGATGIYTDADLLICADVVTRGHGLDYGKGIHLGSGKLEIAEGAAVDISSNGPGLFINDDITVCDGAKLTIDATAAHVYSLNTEMYGVVANGGFYAGEAEIDIAVHAVTATMIPYGGRISYSTGLTAYMIDLDGTKLSVTMDAETADTPYVNGISGISGESLMGFRAAGGAEVEVKIDAQAVDTALNATAEGIASLWEGAGAGLVIEGGSSVTVDVSANCRAIGIDLPLPLEVTGSSLSVNAQSTGDGDVFGILCPAAAIELTDAEQSVAVKAEGGVAIFANDSGEETDFDADYDPELIVISGQARITEPEGGLVSRYGYPYYDNLIPGETVYDPADTGKAAQAFTVSAAAEPAPDEPGDEPADEPEPGPEPEPAAEEPFFDDVSEEDWFCAAVKFAAENGLMNGVGDNLFDPNGTATRAMIAAILYRMAGSPEVDTGTSPFFDVAPEAEGFAPQWYTSAVIWAAENGIVEGYVEGLHKVFKPDGEVTREQFAAMLYRYEKLNGGGFSDLWAFELEFEDAGDISDFALEAVSWCVMKGIIKGRTETAIVPGGSATRAETATMFMRYMQLEG